MNLSHTLQEKIMVRVRRAVQIKVHPHELYYNQVKGEIFRHIVWQYKYVSVQELSFI